MLFISIERPMLYSVIKNYKFIFLSTKKFESMNAILQNRQKYGCGEQIVTCRIVDLKNKIYKIHEKVVTFYYVVRSNQITPNVCKFIPRLKKSTFPFFHSPPDKLNCVIICIIIFSLYSLFSMKIDARISIISTIPFLSEDTMRKAYQLLMISRMPIKFNVYSIPIQ